MLPFLLFFDNLLLKVLFFDIRFILVVVIDKIIFLSLPDHFLPNYRSCSFPRGMSD
jgi:hypothetical protein